MKTPEIGKKLYNFLLSVLKQIFKLDKTNILMHLNVILNKYLKKILKQNKVLR